MINAMDLNPLINSVIASGDFSLSFPVRKGDVLIGGCVASGSATTGWEWSGATVDVDDTSLGDQGADWKIASEAVTTSKTATTGIGLSTSTARVLMRLRP